MRTNERIISDSYSFEFFSLQMPPMSKCSNRYLNNIQAHMVNESFLTSMHLPVRTAEHFSSLQEEVEVKTKKLKKLWAKYQGAVREAQDLQEEFQVRTRRVVYSMKLRLVLFLTLSLFPSPHLSPYFRSDFLPLLLSSYFPPLRLAPSRIHTLPIPCPVPPPRLRDRICSTQSGSCPGP